jgi:hypothetical protein
MIALTSWFDIDPLRFEDQAAGIAAETLRLGASTNRAIQDKRLDHSGSEVPCGHIAQEFESVGGDVSSGAQ